MRTLKILTLPLLFLPLASCAVSEDQEVQMGLQSAPKFEREFGGVYPNEQVQQYVSQIGMSMVPFTGRTDLPWKFRVLNSDQINAFALPGGQVFITKGLLFRLENEAQLAGILGHEAGHVAERHSAEQIQRTQVAQGGATLAGVLGGSTVGDVTSLAANLALLRYSRDQERQADLDGVKYLVQAGYNPHALVDALDVIRRSAHGKSSPEFLSTHPSTKDRERDLSRYIQQNHGDVISSGRLGAEEFQEQVLGKK